MEEDTSAETTPAASPSEAEENSAGAATDAGSPKTESEAPADVGASEAAKDVGADLEEKIDPQLVVLCVILWIVAMGIMGSKYSGMRIDWYLGNIKETLGPLPPPRDPTPPRIDEEAMRALADMAGDEDVVGALSRELSNRGQIDQRYRVAMIVLAARIPGPQSFQLLVDKGASDYDPRVRINAYMSLARRGLAGTAEERELAFRVIHQAMSADPDPMARLPVAQALGEFGDARAGWGLIKFLRDVKPASLRRVPLEALRAVSGKTEAELPFDIEATGDAFIQQIQAWERWYTGQGGVVPEGEGVDNQPPGTYDPVEDEGEDASSDAPNADASKKRDGAGAAPSPSEKAAEEGSQ